jgi:transcriptional regulator with XRE-family HTH domain
VEDWDAVAEAMNARMAVLRVTQQELATKSGVSPATIRELQHNHQPRRRYGRTLSALSEALDWPAQHLDDILNGRDPSAAAAVEQDEVLAELRGIRGELEAIRSRLDSLEGDATAPR